MKVRDLITIDRASNVASTGYEVSLVKLEKLALADVSYTPPPAGLYGAPGTKHFTFQAIAAGKAELRFAVYRPWLLPGEIEYEDVLTFDVEEAAEDAAGGLSLKPGGWKPFEKVYPDAQKVFDEAFQGFVGSDYKALAVTSQLVNGTNYIFAANARPVYPNSHEYPVLIRVFKPLSGPAHRVKFHPLGSPAAVYGGFGPFHDTSDKEKESLKEASARLVGAGYEPLLTSVQVVSGFNFKFIGTAALVTAQTDKFPSLFTVHQPPSGPPVFTGAQKACDLA